MGFRVVAARDVEGAAVRSGVSSFFSSVHSGISLLTAACTAVVVAGSVLAGTKSLYLGMVLFGFLILFDHYKKYWKFLLPAGALCLLGALYILLYQVPEFAQIREQEGFWAALLSYRDQLLVNQTLSLAPSMVGVKESLFKYCK